MIRGDSDLVRAELERRLREVSDEITAARGKLAEARAFVKTSTAPLEKHSPATKRLVDEAVRGERVRIAVALRIDGWSYRAIGGVLGCSGTRVREILIQHGQKVRHLLDREKLVSSVGTSPLHKLLCEDLDLSVRATNCLQNAGISTLADLVSKTEEELLATRNFGRKSLRELQQILGCMGLRLGMGPDEVNDERAIP